MFILIFAQCSLICKFSLTLRGYLLWLCILDMYHRSIKIYDEKNINSFVILNTALKYCNMITYCMHLGNNARNREYGKLLFQFLCILPYMYF